MNKSDFSIFGGNFSSALRNKARAKRKVFFFHRATIQERNFSRAVAASAWRRFFPPRWLRVDFAALLRQAVLKNATPVKVFGYRLLALLVT